MFFKSTFWYTMYLLTLIVGGGVILQTRSVWMATATLIVAVFLAVMAEATAKKVTTNKS